MDDQSGRRRGAASGPFEAGRYVMNPGTTRLTVSARGRTTNRHSGRQTNQGSESRAKPGSNRGAGAQRPASDAATVLPGLLTADDVARVLRTTRRAIYAMVEREQLPAPVRLGRRLLLRQDDLARWLESKQQVL
ncbi:MAG: helix-turn-helix domain-containing protein [Vicinamibacterales bacterium]